MGQAATEDEFVDVTFALTATQLRSEQRRTKVSRAQRSCVRGAIVFAAVLIAINVLMCLGLLLFVLTQHTTPVLAGHVPVGDVERLVQNGQALGDLGVADVAGRYRVDPVEVRERQQTTGLAGGQHLVHRRAGTAVGRQRSRVC